MVACRRLRMLTMVALVPFVLLIPSSSFAQAGVIHGTVTDAETGEGLPGANVVVTSPGKAPTGAATDPSGKYEVRGLTAGTYAVTVSFIGYTKKVLGQITVAAGESTTLDVALVPSGITFNQVVVSASRRQEKILDAPASISIVEAAEIRDRPATTPTDYLRGLPAVDIATNGIAQSNVVVRGFNNIFSGALLTITDNRYAHVPSLRLNANNFIPLTNDDISRIEVVLGPGSALYGPNSAAGVMHIITRSPFESQGTTVSIGGGGRDFLNFSQREPAGGRNIYMASFRHAGIVSDRVGFKISGQYYQGQDWENFDSSEPDTIYFYNQTVTGNDTVSGPIPNQRDFDVEKISAEARLDYRMSDDATLIFNAGFNRGSQIELTGIGAAQVIDWTYLYGQARFSYKDLFAQAFINTSNAGDTYLLQTGALIVDNSKMMVGQIQHGLTLGDRQRFTYGLDALLTRPDTKGTIVGRHENDDAINEFGAYLQSETELSSKLNLVAAARIDDHNYIEDPVFSPRAALVFKPNSNNTFRATYNRAFSTPTSNNLFLDILAASLPTAAVNPGLIPVIGPTFFNVRTGGTAPRGDGDGFSIPSNGGFTFKFGSDGRPQMVSLFGQAMGVGNAYLPPDVNSIWPALRSLIIAAQPEGSIKNALEQKLPQQLSQQVPGVFALLNTETAGFDPVPQSVVANIEQTKPTITNTYEIGYKGLIGEKLVASIDVYHTRIKDFVGPLKIESPHVFMDAERFVEVLTQDLLDNGFPALLAPGTAQAIAEGFAALPIGLVSPVEFQNPTDILFTYRNFGNVTLNGLDLSFSYYANRNWTFSGNYSYVTKQGFNLFKKRNRVIFRNLDGIADVALNAPGNKAALAVKYRSPQHGFETELRGRYVEGFPMHSGEFVGEVQTYSVFDLNLGYDLPFAPHTRFSLTAQNIFDKKHREFIGAPVLGRLVLSRLTYSF